ncbi:MAG: MATE family efflux transporter [Eubacteriales bacterium]|jgi:Na+-driven multidrug efflux pump
MSKSANRLANQSEGKLLFNYALPSIIAILVNALYNMVDQLFIGQGVGLLGNAATNIAFPLTFMCTALSLLFGIGGAANFNLSMGRGDTQRAANIAGNAISMLVLSGIALCVISRTFLHPLLLFFGATPDAYENAVIYTGITSLGFPFLIFGNGFSNLIRSDGSPKYSMFCVLAGAILNTILDPIFIHFWGIAGAAIATVIGQILSCLLAGAYLFQFRTIQLQPQHFRLRLALVGAIVSLGATGFFNQIAMMIVQITMNNILTHYGALSDYGQDIPLAVAGIIAKVNMVCMAFGIGISQGCQPIVGYNYGAQLYPRVKKTYWLAIRAALCIFTVGWLCFQLLPRQIIGLFGEGSEAYFHFAERYFRIYMLMAFANGVQPITSQFFTSIGKAYKGIFLSLTRQVILLLPLIVIFPMFLGIDGVMYAGPVADCAAFLLSLFFAWREMREIDRLEQAKHTT